MPGATWCKNRSCFTRSSTAGSCLSCLCSSWRSSSSRRVSTPRCGIFSIRGWCRRRSSPSSWRRRQAVIRPRGSVGAEVAIAIVALALSVDGAGVRACRPGRIRRWERLGDAITPAGWWYILVSLPILVFFLLRWFWIFLLWAWFLFRVSRLELELTPTHPDRAGGLGFLGWGLACFALVLMAVSAVLSGSFAREILHRGSSLDSSEIPRDRLCGRGDRHSFTPRWLRSWANWPAAGSRGSWVSAP